MNVTEWHTKLKLPATDVEVGKRTKAIAAIIVQGDLRFWHDLIKLYFGKNAEASTTNYLVDTFVAQGCDVPRSKNEKLLQNLSAMILAARLQSAIDYMSSVEKNENQQGDGEADDGDEKSDVDGESLDNDFINKLISFALINYNFFELEKIDNRVPVFTKAGEYQSALRHKEKSLKIPNCQELVSIQDRLNDDGDAFTNDEAIEVTKHIIQLQQSASILAEELNVLWWVQGEYSSLTRKYYVELGYSTTAAIAPLELAMLSFGGHSIQSVIGIIQKVLYISNDRRHEMEPISIKTCFDGLDKEIKNLLLKDFSNGIDVFTPCLFALRKSLTQNDWHVSFGVKVDTPVHPSAIALQLYSEFVYLKSLNKR